MITERTLRKWRKEALESFDEKMYEGEVYAKALAARTKTYEERIVRMTQDLMDIHLLRKVR